MAENPSLSATMKKTSLVGVFFCYDKGCGVNPSFTANEGNKLRIQQVALILGNNV